jgi:hypothetical protein
MTSIDILVAIIASITALFVAVISLIATIINSRQSARSTKELEYLKHKYSQADSVELFSEEQLKTSLGSLKIALQSIQQMKDEMQLILSAVETSLDTKTAIKRVKKARENLFNSYKQYMADLDDAEKDAFHRAKNQAVQIENFLQTNLADKEFVSLLSPEEKTLLREFRNELTDIQYILLDKRSERLTQRMHDHGR